MKKWFVVLMVSVVATMLVACSDKEQSSEKETSQVVGEGAVGFEMASGKIEAVNNVPNNEEKQIRAAFQEYIAAFNDEDIERYMATVSKNPQGFDYNKDREEAISVFEQFDIVRTPADVTIVKYDKKEAQVFANLSIEMLQTSTGAKLNNHGRQVTVFVKEQGEWKVTSVYFIGNNTNAQTNPGATKTSEK